MPLKGGSDDYALAQIDRYPRQTFVHTTLGVVKVYKCFVFVITC